MNEKEVKVCRLCLRLLFREKYFDINYVEPISGFMPFRDQITTCMPELALDILPECYICLNCADSLKAAYEFKNQCLLIEGRIKQYFDSLSSESSCELLNLSKFARRISDGEDLDKNDTINVATDLESEHGIEDTEEVVDEFVDIAETKKEETDIILPSFVCAICQDIFRTAKDLVKHKKTNHNSPFVCNFCNQEFRSLFLLRQHNTLCKEKESKIPWGKASQKRPHLPAKAKNHLTEWLFHHQQHPYPTDFEKQCLMKETNLTLVQVENWFINARRRVLLDFSKRKRFSSKIKSQVSESPVVS